MMFLNRKKKYDQMEETYYNLYLCLCTFDKKILKFNNLLLSESYKICDFKLGRWYIFCSKTPIKCLTLIPSNMLNCLKLLTFRLLKFIMNGKTIIYVGYVDEYQKKNP